MEYQPYTQEELVDLFVCSGNYVDHIQLHHTAVVNNKDEIFMLLLRSVYLWEGSSHWELPDVVLHLCHHLSPWLLEQLQQCLYF